MTHHAQRGQHCGDIELAGYLANEAGPLPLVLNLRIAHDRVGSRNIMQTTTTDHRLRYHLCLLLLVRLGGYIVNLSDFYSYRIIGKLTVFLQVQEVIFRKQTVPSRVVFVTWFFLLYSNLGLEIFSPRLHLYVLILT
jgi:hypothetical protein